MLVMFRAVCLTMFRVEGGACLWLVDVGCMREVVVPLAENLTTAASGKSVGRQMAACVGACGDYEGFKIRG